MRQPFGAPDLFRNASIEFLSVVQVSPAELRMRHERQSACAYETGEAGVSLVCPLVQALSQQIVLQVMRPLLCVRPVSVTSVEALRQQQEATNPVAILRKIRRMPELVGVSFRMIGPDVLDFVPVSAMLLDILLVP